MSKDVTTDEAAVILGVTARRVRGMIAAGELRARVVGEGRRATYYISRADLKLAMHRRKPGRPPKEKPDDK